MHCFSVDYAKKKDKRFKEVKSVVKTWVVGADAEGQEKEQELTPVSVPADATRDKTAVRRRTRTA